MDFIAANESPLFKKTFRLYVKWLFRATFKKIWIRQSYLPSPNSRTVYFMNHTSWWDGLIPFLLNEYRFNQQARAFMDLQQMQTYPFFKWMGVFSIDSDNRTHTLRSLKYAVKSMQRPRSSLYIFPQGEIKPATQKMVFKSGIGWLHNQLPEVDFVPIGIHMHTVRHRKAELHFWVDEPVEPPSGISSKKMTTLCEQRMDKILDALLQSAGFDDKKYDPFF